MKTNEENNSMKVLKYVGMGIVAIAGFFLARRAFKKELEKVEEAQETAKTEIKDLGASPERVQEQVIEHEEESERNFTKALYAVASDPESSFGKSQTMSDFIMNGEDDVDYSVNKVTLDDYFIDDRLMDSRDKIIHVTEDKIGGNRYFRVLLGIPEYTNDSGNYNKLRIQDVLRSMSNAGDYIRHKIIGSKYPEPNFKWKKVVAVLEYEYSCVENDTRHLKFLEIPNWILNKMYDNPNETLNKAVRLYEDWDKPDMVYEIKEKIGGKIYEKLLEDAKSKEADEDGGTVIPESISERRICLMYSMIFQAEDFITDTCEINLSKAIEILEYLLGNVEEGNEASAFRIERKGRRGDNPEAILDSHKYERVIFHAPNKSGVFDSLSRYYQTDKEGNISYYHLKSSPEETKNPEPMREPTVEELQNLLKAYKSEKKGKK